MGSLGASVLLPVAVGSGADADESVTSTRTRNGALGPTAIAGREVAEIQARSSTGIRSGAGAGGRDRIAGHASVDRFWVGSDGCVEGDIAIGPVCQISDKCGRWRSYNSDRSDGSGNGGRDWRRRGQAIPPLKDAVSKVEAPVSERLTCGRTGTSAIAAGVRNTLRQRSIAGIGSGAAGIGHASVKKLGVRDNVRVEGAITSIGPVGQ